MKIICKTAVVIIGLSVVSVSTVMADNLRSRIERSVSHNKGVVQINQTAGDYNNSSNIADFSGRHGIKDVGDNFLAKSHIRKGKYTKGGKKPRGKRSVSYDEHSFTHNKGVVQSNQIAGSRNNARNHFSLEISKGAIK